MKKLLSSILLISAAFTCALSLYTAPAGSIAADEKYVPSYISGDLNADGKIDGRDAILLLKQAEGKNAAIKEKAAADLNADGKADKTDVQLMLQVLADWNVKPQTAASVPIMNFGEYDNKVNNYNSLYSVKDSLGRSVSSAGGVSAGDSTSRKYVGIFYFLWLGAHGLNLYDNTKIVNEYPDALQNENRWGPVGSAHFWGEPLFGYYVSNDTWVMRKHVQMLTDAGIDFIVFDTTNSTGQSTSSGIANNGGGNNTYIANALAIMKILDEYSKQGWNVPKVAFYTNSNSGGAMNVIYKEVYKAHPEYKHLWFNWEGKPMIVGISSQANAEVRSFFRIKESQWPNEGKKNDGFPWMEFDRLLSSSSIYNYNGKKLMNVSIAQHNVTVRMSSAAWYGGGDRTRSYSPSDGKVRKEEGAVLYGYNFASQWDFALKNDPDLVFITGWNEWIAQRQPGSAGQPIVFVDNASMEASRDAEPMKGGYGDNYYMQMIDYIRRFKGTSGNTYYDHNTTIDISGAFGQWDYIRAVYRDYKNDTVNRNQSSHGGIKYTNTTGRNDIIEAKVCNNKDYIYFFVQTAANITSPAGNNWMNLYIKTSSSGTWQGYDYVLNHTAPGSRAVLEKFNSNGTLTKVADVEYKLSGKTMMIAVPVDKLGISRGTTTKIEFKWTDNCTFGDIFSFYTDGDAAPIGRVNYVYEYSAG